MPYLVMANDPDRNPLHTTLLIVRDIIDHPYTTAELQARYDASDRQIKRYIAEARHLGADLHTERTHSGSGGRYLWQCRNAADLKMLDTWIDLENRRSLIEPGAQESA
ncbi:MAG: hypothetical protein LC667_18960 [Thioalkalivibrio sp.]|nr:hypothetical protein [Thioalkalivibrio sp.]